MFDWFPIYYLIKKRNYLNIFIISYCISNTIIQVWSRVFQVFVLSFIPFHILSFLRVFTLLSDVTTRKWTRTCQVFSKQQQLFFTRTFKKLTQLLCQDAESSDFNRWSPERWERLFYTLLYCFFRVSGWSEDPLNLLILHHWRGIQRRTCTN